MQKSRAISEKSLLHQAWQQAFGRPAPTACHPSFLHKAIEWQKQVNQHGGLNASERRRLLGEVSAENANASAIRYLYQRYLSLKYLKQFRALASDWSEQKSLFEFSK